MNFISNVGMALFMSLGMFWQVGWSLALGFTIAATIEAVVPKENIQKKFGKSGFKEIALATGFGAISSSCSYAAASTSKTLFKKGASFISSVVHVRSFLYHDGAYGTHYVRAVRITSSNTSSNRQYSIRAYPIQFQLYVLAQPHLRMGCGIFHLLECEKPYEPWA